MSAPTSRQGLARPHKSPPKEAPIGRVSALTKGRSVTHNRKMHTRASKLAVALLVSLVVLLLPFARLGEVTSGAEGDIVSRSFPIGEDDDRTDDDVCVKAAVRPAREALPDCPAVQRTDHPPTVPIPVRLRTAAPPERSGDNGCGAVLRC